MRKSKRPDMVLSEDTVMLLREQITQGISMVLSNGVTSDKALKGVALILDVCRWFDADAKERFNPKVMETPVQSAFPKTAPLNQEDSSHTSVQA